MGSSCGFSNTTPKTLGIRNLNLSRSIRSGAMTNISSAKPFITMIIPKSSFQPKKHPCLFSPSLLRLPRKRRELKATTRGRRRNGFKGTLRLSPSNTGPTTGPKLS